MSGGRVRPARETAQPSLWDRLLNDLPGLSSEIEGLRRVVLDDLGAERLAALLDAGARAIDADAGLTGEHKRILHRLLFLERRRMELDARGVVVSAEVLREAVRRDIEALFNCERFEAVPLLTDLERAAFDDVPPSLDAFPEVRRSVVNYGVPSFSGRTAGDFEPDTLAREIRAVLAAFEPRLKPSATKVQVTIASRNRGLEIEIDGLLLMAPAAERLRLRTTIDLDNGAAKTLLAEV